MPTYTTYGNLDDRILKDGDVGFVGFNNRVRPDQLQSGFLADAQNVRLDRNGEAQVRKGVDLLIAPLAVGSSALTLPFYLVADDSSVTVTQTGGDLVITNVDATNFPSTGTINLSGVTGITPDPNGNRAFTRNSSTQITISDQTYTGTAGGTATVKFGILADDAVNAIYGSANYSDPNAAASQYIVIVSNSKAIAVKLSDSSTTDISYPTGVSISQSVDVLQAFNKVFIFRDGETALEWDGSFINETAVSLGTFANGGMESYSATEPGQFTASNTGGVGRVWKSFSSTQTSGKKIKVTFDVTSLTNNVKVDLFSVIGGASVTAEGPQTITTGSNSFTFTLTSNSDAIAFDTESTVSSIALEGLTSVEVTDPAFTKVSSGTYSQPKQLSPTRVDITDGKATATFANLAAMNGLQVGDTFIVETAGSPATFDVGTQYIVAARDDSTFTIDFFVQLANASNVTGVIFQQPVSVGLGFTHMPAPPFAIYHQRRLVMPFKNSVDASADSFTSRGILDEIIASDLLDSDTYDQIYGSYRFNAGTADFVVGLHSFTDDKLMVFNRNSIHLVSNTVDLTSSSVRLLTDEVGCVARKSIQQVGNRVVFLSDNGVYGTEFLDEYNLRGTQTPLSEPINETIKRINKEHASKAVSAYFDNRYFIAVPLDNATENNAILIFNFLNNQWESIDTVNDPNYHTTNLIIAGSGDERAVYSVNDIGGIHKVDGRTDGTDTVITQIGGSQQNLRVPASMTTRQFTYGTLERKRFKAFEIHTQSSDTNVSDFDISIEIENPDSTEALGSLNSFNGGDLAIGEDVSIRGRIGGLRGYGAQYTINNTTGRPRIRAIESSASDAFRSTKKAI